MLFDPSPPRPVKEYSLAELVAKIGELEKRHGDHGWAAQGATDAGAASPGFARGSTDREMDSGRDLAE